MNEKKKYDVHGTVPVVAHITVEAESEEEAIQKAYKEFGGVNAYCGNGGMDKLIGVEGDHESITVDGNAEFDDCTEC